MNEDCIFCKIVKGEIPSEFLYETDTLVVFRDISPKAPVHLLIVPKVHIRSVNDIIDMDAAVLSDMMFAAKTMAAQCGVAESGYRLQYNVEKGGGQEVFHLHMHLMGGWK